MSDQATQENTEQEGTEAPQWVKDLRKQVKDQSAELEALRPLRQENHLLRHNVDPNAPTTKLFLKGWDGDWTDGEAVAEAIKEYELPTAKAEEEEGSNENQPHPDAQTHQRIEQAGGDSQKVTPPGTKPDYSQANSQEELLRMYREAGGFVAEG